NLVTGVPQGADFVVGQNALPSLLFGRLLYASAGRCLEDVFATQPVEELREVGKRPVGHYRARLGNLLDEFSYFALPDVVDGTSVPLRQNKIVQDMHGLPL